MLELRGPSGALRGVGDAIHPAVVIDMSDAQPGEHTFSIGERNVKLMRGVRLVRAIPSEVRFQFEPRRTRTVPVRVRFLSEGQNGYVVSQCQVDPPDVEITGPRSRVARIAAVIADPIDLAQRHGHLEVPCECVRGRSFCAFPGCSGSGGHRDHEEEVMRRVRQADTVLAHQGEGLGKQLFGTDGIRGVAGEYPLDPSTVYAFGVALGKDAAAHAAHPEILIGTDTRESGYVDRGNGGRRAWPARARACTTPE